MFRSVHSPAGVHQNLCSGFGVGTLERRVSTPLPGRLAGLFGVGDPSFAASGSGSPVLQGSGDHCKLRKV